jgi:hypothetical protein
MFHPEDKIAVGDTITCDKCTVKESNLIKSSRSDPLRVIKLDNNRYLIEINMAPIQTPKLVPTVPPKTSIPATSKAISTPKVPIPSQKLTPEALLKKDTSISGKEQPDKNLVLQIANLTKDVDKLKELEKVKEQEEKKAEAMAARPTAMRGAVTPQSASLEKSIRDLALKLQAGAVGALNVHK